MTVVVRTFFLYQEIWEVVEDGYQEQEQASLSGNQLKQYKEIIKKDASALCYIQQRVNKSIFPRIFGIKKAKEAWEVLRQEFQGAGKVISIKLQTLWRDFDNLMMKETEKFQEFFSRVAEIVNQIRSYGDTIEEKKIVEKILRSLPQRFEHVVTKKFHMAKCKPAPTPVVVNGKLSKNDSIKKADETLYRKLVGSLIYLTNTRPDIVYAVSIVSRFMSEPSKLHFAAAKSILKYVKGTQSYGIFYTRDEDHNLIGYTNSDWAGSSDDRKSTSGKDKQNRIQGIFSVMY
ncbi:hypothetical protein RJ640_012781 [Escallonia rubra]|uniref:Uncharacterized protein n=1 Tax=Escallonia rubra TaxID=112253 RepID=A0AA88RQW1_9ASTE|nr:hypothetical protein RJ640_012781 [Escallonia rubra]